MSEGIRNLLGANGVARAFLGGRVTHPEGQFEEGIIKKMRKMKKKMIEL